MQICCTFSLNHWTNHLHLHLHTSHCVVGCSVPIIYPSISHRSISKIRMICKWKLSAEKPEFFVCLCTFETLKYVGGTPYILVSSLAFSCWFSLFLFFVSLYIRSDGFHRHNSFCHLRKWQMLATHSHRANERKRDSDCPVEFANAESFVLILCVSPLFSSCRAFKLFTFFREK